MPRIMTKKVDCESYVLISCVIFPWNAIGCRITNAVRPLKRRPRKIIILLGGVVCNEYHCVYEIVRISLNEDWYV